MTVNIFYALSVVAVLSALMVVFTKKPVNSVLFLIVTLFCIAGHYILLNAQFLAAVHVIVYAGAIMVLFLYVIMMLNLTEVLQVNKPDLLRIAAVVSGGILLIVLVGSLKGLDTVASGGVDSTQSGLIERLGYMLYRDYLLPFELSSILFLTAMVGAVMIAKSDEKIIN